MSVANSNSEPGTDSESKNAGENVTSDEEKVCLDSDKEESLRHTSTSIGRTSSSENESKNFTKQAKVSLESDKEESFRQKSTSIGNKNDSKNESKDFSGTGTEEIDKTISHETTDNIKHSQQLSDNKFLNSTEPRTEEEDIEESIKSLQVKPRTSTNRSKRSILFTLVQSNEDDDSVGTGSTTDTATVDSSVASSTCSLTLSLICKRKGTTLAGEHICLTCVQDERSLLHYFPRQVITNALIPLLEQLGLLQLVLPFSYFDWDKLILQPKEKLRKLRGQGDELIFSPYYEYESNPSWKLQFDRHELQNIIFDTSDKIFSEGWYPALAKYLEDLEFLKNETTKIIVQNHELRVKLSTLNKKYKEVKEESVNLNLPEKRSNNTKAEDLNDLQITFAACERYTTAWEQARLAQNTMKITLQQNKFADTLQNLLSFREREIRIHGEIEMFLINEIQNLEQLTAYWTERYNGEIEDRDTELVHLSAQKESTENTMKTMLTTFHERVEVIKEVTEFFANLEKEAQLKFLRNKGAITIQKWWKRYLRIKRKFKLMAKKAKKK